MGNCDTCLHLRWHSLKFGTCAEERGVQIFTPRTSTCPKHKEGLPYYYRGCYLIMIFTDVDIAKEFKKQITRYFGSSYVVKKNEYVGVYAPVPHNTLKKPMARSVWEKYKQQALC